METYDLGLPDGLELNPMGPSQLTELWPMTELNSSIGSIITTLAIYAGLFFAALILAHLSKTFLPRILNKIVPVLFLLTSVAVIVSACLAFLTWNQPKGISNEAMGVQVTRVTNWVGTQGVSMDNEGVWDLVCFYYDGKNEYCDETSPTVYYKGQPVQVHLQKDTNGNFELYDFKNKIALKDK